MAKKMSVENLLFSRLDKIEEKLDKNSGVLHNINEQTIKTNGRVTQLESFARESTEEHRSLRTRLELLEEKQKIGEALFINREKVLQEGVVQKRFFFSQLPAWVPYIFAFMMFCFIL
jgi:hypothetical protein